MQGNKIITIGELPLLKDGSVWIAGLDRILAHLCNAGKDANDHLSEEQKADYLAYSTLVQERLYDCMLYSWYADSTNFIKNIRPTYAKLLPFPTRYFVPIQLKKSAKARLAKYNVEITGDDVGLPQNEKEEMKELLKSGWHYMYQLARDTYSTLQSQLDNNTYMFGEQPSTLDCIVFGYLALHLYPDLAHRRLQHILQQEYPRLAEYCNRIKDVLFADTEESILESESADDVPSVWKTLTNNPTGFFSTIKDDVVSYMGNSEEKKEKSQAQIDFERKRIWSIAGGVTFFLAYIIYNGILSIEIASDDDDDEYYYQEDDD
ncbi:Tom37 C-terminal domain-containing protein [Blakeslea trispora]|nr:Tom37 C-terminal domain-containing protein [Blakeslea trispora]